MKTRFTTTIDDELLSQLKILAIQQKVNVNDILNSLIKLYVNGEVLIVIDRKK